MKMRLLTALWVSLAMTMFVGCGDDEDDSDDGNNNGQPVNPNPPVGDAVPSAFSNTATSQADLAAKTDTVKTEIVGEAKTDLGMTGAASGVISFMMAQATGDFDPATQAADVDLGALGGTFAEGDDCSGLYDSIASADKSITEMFTYASTKAPVADDFTVDDATAAGMGYTVETIEDDRYAWHYKLVPAEGGMAFLTPALEMAMGATETEVAMLVISHMAFDSSDFPTDGGQGQSGAQDFSMNVLTEMNLYANTETKTAKIGIDTTAKMSGQEGAPGTDMHMVSDVTIQSGDNASIVQNMTITGTSGGESLDGFVTMSITKVSEGTYTFDWSGSHGGQTFDSAVTVTGNATTCSVESAAVPSEP